METDEAEVVMENTVARGTSKDTVGHKTMVETKGQPAEPNTMAIKTKLHSKTKWEAAP